MQKFARQMSAARWAERNLTSAEAQRKRSRLSTACGARLLRAFSGQTLTRTPWQVSPTLSSSRAFLFLCFFDQFGNSVQFLCRDLEAFLAEQSRDSFSGRAFKKCIDKVPQCRLSHHVSGNFGEINVTQTLFFMAKMALFLQNTKLRAHRGIRRLSRQPLHDLADSRPP